MSDPSFGTGRARPQPPDATRRVPADSSYAAYGGAASPYDAYDAPGPAEEKPPPRVNAGRVWAGGVGAAVVVALLIIVAILLLRGVFGLDILAPEGAGAYGSVDTTTYALSAALVTLVATGVLHVLLLGMPNPMTFFYWIGVLTIAIAVILPWTVIQDDLASQLATSGLNAVAGLCMVTVLGSVGKGAVRETAGFGRDPRRSAGYRY